MAIIIKFPENENTWYLRHKNNLPCFDTTSIPRQKTWADYTKEEKIAEMMEEMWGYPRYLEFLSMQRFQKMLDDHVILLPYQAWINTLFERGDVK